ncbi:hypothetical protein [Sphingobium sp. SYK-6]|uniref:hypothetical protein n=1 Tax=Sphingobium sp. (strain NBRC 103272 / SYK-6) TaxID=627192 RepID=UPI00059DBFC0|nr:hypothetical protein [Sphingobium sp. SYK-6]
MTRAWPSHGSRGQWFAIAMLLALASALIPALVHSGLPATTPLGSAFDPSTNVVALHSRKQAPLATLTATLKDGNASGCDTGMAAMPARSPCEVPARTAASGPAGMESRTTAQPREARWRARSAREPPLRMI